MASDSSEVWGWWGGGLVVVGVLAEFALAIIHPAYDAFWERWGTALADLLIGVGVAVEIIFARMGHRYDGELKRRSAAKLAEANERAAKAELETARLRAGIASRSLSEEQKAVFVGLNGQIKAVNFMFSGGYEPMHFGMQILTALLKGGAEVRPLPPQRGGFAWTGIQLWVDDTSENNPLVAAFTATGLLHPDNRVYPISFLSLDVPKDVPLICVGERSPIEQA